MVDERSSSTTKPAVECLIVKSLSVSRKGSSAEITLVEKSSMTKVQEDKG
jgi:hypothetical protein